MSRKIIILTGLLIVLGLVIFVFEKPFHNRFEQTDLKSFFPDLKTEEVVAIEIEYFINGTRLEKVGEAWFVRSRKTELAQKLEKQEKKESSAEQKFPADPQKVDDLLEVMVNLKKGEPISANTENQNLFQVGKTGLKIALFDKEGKKIASLLIGKQGPNLFSTFVRDENSDEIYLVDEYLQGIVNVPLEEWKAKEPRNTVPISPSPENNP